MLARHFGVLDSLAQASEEVPDSISDNRRSLARVSEAVSAQISDSRDSLAQASEEELASIHEIGPLSAHAIASFFADKQSQQTIRDLFDAGLTFAAPAAESESGALASQRFVFTGSLSSMTRSQAGERVKSLGGIVVSSISKNTDFIVLGENPGSKADKAREIGVLLLSESEFLELLKSHE